MAFPGREIRVASWLELMAELHSAGLIPIRGEEGGHRRSPYVFRGMDDAEWGLDTSLQRLPGIRKTLPDVVERSLLRSFRKYASAGTFDRQSEWYVLAVAQHNGLPTRCLDWSASPLVAVHFAVGDERLKHKDGVVWCLNAARLREVNAAALRGISWVYDTRLLEKSFADLDALDASAKDGELMILWEPPSIDQRIASQSGLLSMMNGGAVSQGAFLERHAQAHADLVLRIVITASMKAEARDMLDQNNISERSLYPGLPGLCAWLKRYYGAAW
ncbi:MAG: FRG domain-containing protein [Bryobacteraceae bacterium]|nr:FRG domain-containing protein [Bryobacteraceae bacterium]